VLKISARSEQLSAHVVTGLKGSKIAKRGKNHEGCARGKIISWRGYMVYGLMCNSQFLPINLFRVFKNVSNKGLVSCLDPGLHCCDERTYVCEKGGCPMPDLAPN
jgi:hypothetical protein